MLLEGVQDGTQAVELGPDVVPHQRDGGASSEEPDLPQPLQSGDEALQGRALGEIALGVQGDGEIRLGGGDEVHREPLVGEVPEDLRQEAHLLPHPDGLEHHEGHVPLDRDGLELRGVGAVVTEDHGPLALRLQRALHVHRDVRAAERGYAPGVQDLASRGGDLLCLPVAQPPQQSGRRDQARVGGEHARDVGPDLQPSRLEPSREQGRRGVRAPPTQDDRVPRGILGDEALSDVDAAFRRRIVDPGLEGGIGCAGTGGREVPAPGVPGPGRVGRRGLGREDVAGVEPAGVQPPAPERLHPQLGRHQLTQAQHRRPDPGCRLSQKADALHGLLEPVHLLGHPGGAVQPEAHRHRLRAGPDLVDPVVTPSVHGLGHGTLQERGYAGEGGEDEEGSLAVGQTGLGELRHPVPPLRSGNRGAAELEDDPGAGGGRPAWCAGGHGPKLRRAPGCENTRVGGRGTRPARRRWRATRRRGRPAGEFSRLRPARSRSCPAPDGARRSTGTPPRSRRCARRPGRTWSARPRPTPRVHPA